MKKIKIAHLYYDLMNLYGENGNVRFLKRKLEEQGIQVEIYFLSLEDEIDYNKYDFYYIGMGSDENKNLVLEDMKKDRDKIVSAIENEKFFLVTGNSLELFGKNIINLDGASSKGIGAFNYDINLEEFRIVGEQYYKCDFIEHNIIGFQNRSSIMNDKGDNLFKVIKGTGYNPNVEFEGILEKNFYGTYLLGPILVRNPYFTDYLVKKICESKKFEYKKPDFNDASYKAYQEYLKNFYESQ